MEVVLGSSASFSNAAMLATPAVPAISSTVATVPLQDQQIPEQYLAQLLYFCTNGPTVEQGDGIRMTIGTSYMVTSGNEVVLWFICII
jgi:hypothetical protein